MEIQETQAYVFSSSGIPLYFGSDPLTPLVVTPNGRVGIGEFNPLAKLHVQSSFAEAATFEWGGGNSLSIKTQPEPGRVEVNAIGDGLLLQVPGHAKLFLSGNGGGVGVNTTSPSGFFDVNGSAFVRDGLYVYGGLLENGAYAYRSNNKSTWDQASDRRLKTNIKAIRNPLLDLLRLRGRTFEYRNRPGELRRGFIAQEVQSVYPDWVSVGRDGYLMINPDGFPALAVESMREQQSQIDALTKENARLKEEIQDIWKELKKRR
jgi:hypothetical protein